MSSLTMKPTIQVQGRTWRLFAIDYDTADGKFSTYIYALSWEHAHMMLDELKQTARIGGQVEGFENA